MGHSLYSYVHDSVTHALVELLSRKSLLVVNYNRVPFTLLPHDKNRQKKSTVFHIYWVWWENGIKENVKENNVFSPPKEIWLPTKTSKICTQCVI